MSVEEILARRAPGWETAPAPREPRRPRSTRGLRPILNAGTAQQPAVDARCPACTTRVPVIDKQNPPVRCAHCVALGVQVPDP